MKHYLHILFLFLLSFFISHKTESQNTHSTNRYLNTDYFSRKKIKVDSNVTYGIAKDWKGLQDTQRVNVFFPKLKGDTLKQRPFILLMHGGGFHTEDDFSQKNQWNKLCLMLAQRGFVTATIDYRVGWDDKDKEWNPKGNIKSSSVFAAYRAYQDARAALRYFIHNWEDYGIDTNNIFIGGRSAGGDISLVTAFLSQEDIDALVSKIIPESCHKLFGSLDSSTNDLTNKYKIRGVLNMWGPIPDTAYISKEEALAIPVIMFHGTNDQAVPYKRFCPPVYPYTRDGSYNIALRYKHLGGCYQLNTKLKGGHGEDFSNEFLAEHISLFIKNVLTNNCKSEEFESSVSLQTKIINITSSHLFIPVSVSLLILFIIFIRVIIRRKRKRVVGDNTNNS